MPDPRSDFELLEAWGVGDKAAGRLLYDRHFSVLFRFLRTKVDDGYEDLLQNVWLACVEGRERVRNRDSFRAYLLQTARFQLYAHYRKRSANRVLDFSSTSIVDLTKSPSSLIVQREQERLLLEALRRVPLDCQIVIELSFWDDLTGREIAEVLCVPEGTVRSRLRRATEQLRSQLAALSGGAERLSDTEDDLHSWALRLREQAGPGSRRER